MSLLELRNLAVTDINTAFSGQFVAEGAFTPEFDLSKLEDLKVVIVPTGIESTVRMNRANKWERLPQLQIGIGRREQPNAAPPVTIDNVLTVAEAIRDYYETLPDLQGTNIYAVVGVNFLPFYDYQELDDTHVVLSIVAVTFKTFTV